MKKFNLILVTVLVALMVFTSCSKNEDGLIPTTSLENMAFTSQPTSVPYSKENSDIAGLKFMREEEKLARDVYDHFYINWNSTIFDNISNSEQVHMDRVLDLLTFYGVEDPAQPEPGVFSNQELQELYNTLIEAGESSVEDALVVGATIEEVDMVDIQNLLDQTEDENIQCLYGNLLKGSRNHLRSFYNKLVGLGIIYTPQFLSDEDFYAIVNTPHETGGTQCNF
ncbi:MAG: DUF2202 domain-containing protein [Bacteroidales bacterium]|nr:DUF2202 domain-containing protein [Bacteroidales bacterium]